MTDPTGATETARRDDTAAPTDTAAGTPAPQPEWTGQVTDLIVDSVDKVRSRTTGPILEISQGAVHALVALILAVPVLVLLLAGTVRLLDWAVPGDVWIIYAGLGIILSLVGVVLWGQRTPRRR